MFGSCSAHTVPITDRYKEVFGSRREELKVSYVKLLQLDGLTELNDEPEQEQETKLQVQKSQEASLHSKQELPLTRFCYHRGSACTSPCSPSIWPTCSVWITFTNQYTLLFKSFLSRMM